MSPIASDGSESGVGSESNPYSDGDQDNRLVCNSKIKKLTWAVEGLLFQAPILIEQ